MKEKDLNYISAVFMRVYTQYSKFRQRISDTNDLCETLSLAV